MNIITIQERVYYDLSAIWEKYLGRIIIEQTYKLGEKDWVWKLKDEIKELL